MALDDKTATEKITNELWKPMWTHSYNNGEDLDVDEVMNGLDIDREPTETLSERELAKMESDIDLSKLKNSQFYEEEEEDQGGGCVVS